MRTGDAERLHEHLHCEARLEFVVSLVGEGTSQALITDDFGTARKEAEFHASSLLRRGMHSQVPTSTHELHREQRMAWTHSDRSRGTLTIGRLAHHQALCPEAEPQSLVAVLGKRLGTPILFIATGQGSRGEHHLELLRKRAPGIRLKRFPAIDIRGAIVSSTAGMKHFGSVAMPSYLSPLPGEDFDVGRQVA
jgi:hypothetical protein